MLHEGECPLLTPLTVEELMVLAHCSRPTAYRWLKSGKLPSIKIGHRRLIPRGSVARLLAPKGDK
ncbi:MAG: DNA-binding protein [Nitrospira sp. LK70]|nr:DNA-binding protein [Nitrospira sp. LK70]